LRDEAIFVEVLMNGQQTHGSDAELPKVGDRFRMGESGVATSYFLRYTGVAVTEAPDVQLVKHGVIGGVRRGAITPPIVGIASHASTKCRSATVGIDDFFGPRIE
jgi:hypothetical protein